MKRAPRWYDVVAVFAVCITLTIVTNLLTQASQRRAEQQWCELIRLQDNVYRDEPPQTSTGKKLAEGYRTLRDSRCPGERQEK